MKSKKFLLPIIILVVAILLIGAVSVVSSIAKKPTITEAEFPFTITYEFNGETVTINDVYRVKYCGNGGYADTKTRIYEGEIGNMGEGNTVYTLKREELSSERIELWTHFYPDYLMGDSEYDYFDDEAFEPRILYYDDQEIEYTDEETLSAQGAKLVSFEYPTPIKNSFVFSHVSYFSNAVVTPAILIAFVALLATIIFVRKEKDVKYKAAAIISIVLNCLVGTFYLGFVTILAWLIDIEGGCPEFYYQVMYFIPAFSLLCIAASTALRRKGKGVISIFTGLMGPAVFALYLIVYSVYGLL